MLLLLIKHLNLVKYNHGVGLAREEFIINNYIKVHPMALLNFNEITDKKTRKEIIEITSGYTDMVDYFVKKLSFGIARIASAFYPKNVIVRFSDLKLMNMLIYWRKKIMNHMKKIQ